MGGDRHLARAAARLLFLCVAVLGIWLCFDSRADAAGDTRYDGLPGADPNAAAITTRTPWNHSNLTYRFINITDNGTRSAIRAALTYWMPGTNLSFSEVDSGTPADLDFQYGSIDGPANVLANAYYPPNGLVTFDSSESWTLGLDNSAGPPYDLQTVAGHEIGHALGLDHSGDPGALMYAQYSVSHRYLADDDRSGVISLYGTGNNPFGFLDVAAQGPSSGEGAQLAGWVQDPNSTSSAIYVHIYVDGAYKSAVLASRYRSDVGYHSFDFNQAMSQGTHQVCAYGINIGLGVNALLGCKNLSVRHDPLTGLNTIWDYGTGVRAIGWSFDYASPSTALSVEARVDGTLASTFTANAYRPDVPIVIPGVGSSHGFDAVVPVAAGTHQVCLTAKNIGLGADTSIGCQSVVVAPNPFPTTDLRYQPLTTPQRVYDSRVSGGKLAQSATRQVPIGSVGGIPTGAKAVAVNVTAVSSGATYVTAWPSGAPLPGTSTLNTTQASIVANGALIGLLDGKINLFNAQGQTDVIVDVTGYFDAAPVGSGGYRPIQPRRLADTRTSVAVGSGEERAIDVAAVAGIPSSGVEAVALNVTGTDASSGTYVTVWPGGTRPMTSLLNLDPGAVKANNIAVGLGSDGKVRLFNATGTVHVVVDIVGYWTSGTTKNFTAIMPTRAYDSREVGSKSMLAPGESRTIQIAGVGGVPTTGARAVAVNLTAAPSGVPGFLRVYPSNSAVPATSTLNYTNSATANGTMVGIGSDGKITVTNYSGSTHLIVDVTGWTT